MSVVGTVEVMRENHWQRIETGETLKVGEAIKTADGSRIAMQLANGAQLKMNANSQMELKQIVPRKEGLTPASTSSLRNILRLLGGEVWMNSNGLPLEIETIPVTATIRGTEFNLAVGPGEVA
ncbi:MAG TPA: FecR family protein, partial [Candidatus Competibacter sp.]|nr:FecR family protein [Candidatus Competibacter sp.]